MFEETVNTEVKNEENNKLSKGDKVVIVIKIILSAIMLFLGVTLLIGSIGYRSSGSVSYLLDSVTVNAYNARYQVFEGTNRSPSEVKALITYVRAHNNNQQEVYDYGKIALYYYGLEPSEDKSTENDNLTEGIIKNTYKYDIDVIAYHKGNGCIAKIRIIARKFSDDSPRIITDAKLDESLFTTDFPDTKTSIPKVEDRKIKITDGSDFALGIFTSLLFAYYIISNIILLFAKEYSKKNAILELIFMAISALPAIVMIGVMSFQLLSSEYGIAGCLIYLIFDLACIFVLTRFITAYNDFIKTNNYKKNSKTLIKLAFVFMVIYLLFAISRLLIERVQVAKPIIYLYPEEQTNLQIVLNNEESLTTTYPKYDQEGWRVTAYPNGDLIDLKTGKKLYSLYWEGNNNIDKSISTGFVVKGQDVAEFLDEKLEILGLNYKEREELIVYWLPKLEHNNYNFIRFDLTDECNSYMPLEINEILEDGTIQKADVDTLIRVLMIFKPLDKPIEVEEQILPQQEKSGFTVVEWGGSEI